MISIQSYTDEFKQKTSCIVWRYKVTKLEDCNEVARDVSSRWKKIFREAIRMASYSADLRGTIFLVPLCNHGAPWSFLFSFLVSSRRTRERERRARPRSPKKRLSEPEYPGPVALGQPLSLLLCRPWPQRGRENERKKNIYTAPAGNKPAIVTNFRPGQGYAIPPAGTHPVL